MSVTPRKGIQTLIILITAIATIHDDVRKALEDKKISAFEYFGIALSAGRNWTIISQFKQIREEVLDLTDDEVEFLTAHFATVWRVPKPGAELRWRAAFQYLTETTAFINKWRLADELQTGEV